MADWPPSEPVYATSATAKTYIFFFMIVPLIFFDTVSDLESAEVILPYAPPSTPIQDPFFSPNEGDSIISCKKILCQGENLDNCRKIPL
jgi:hypothetical protein